VFDFMLTRRCNWPGVRLEIECNMFVPWTPFMEGKDMLTGRGGFRPRIADYKQIDAHELKFRRLREKCAREGIR
jgi:hypothetical protein